MSRISEILGLKSSIKEGKNGSVTIISFNKSISDIENFNELPEEIKKEIKAVEVIESRGFQELLGFSGRKVVWSLGGGWSKDSKDGEDTFTATSFGSSNWQWNGSNLRRTEDKPSKLKEIKTSQNKQNLLDLLDKWINNIKKQREVVESEAEDILMEALTSSSLEETLDEQVNYIFQEREEK